MPGTPRRPLAKERAAAAVPWRLSNGEIHFLWHFIDGGIMNVDTRVAMHRGWGMCERHAFAFLAVDAAFRSGFMHGPAILYQDLMQRAVAALRPAGVPCGAIVARRVRDRGCLMCSLGYGPGTHGMASRWMLERGGDLTAIHRFARETAAGWRRWTCGRCAASGAAIRCRVHLREDLARGSASLEEQRRCVAELAVHVKSYARSFRWELRGTDTAEDRAALIGAVGWCSGWRIWLDLSALRDPSDLAAACNPARDPGDR